MLLRLNIIVLRFLQRKHCTTIHSFPSLYSIPLYDYTTSLLIHPLKCVERHIWVVFSFLVLRVVLLLISYIFVLMHICRNFFRTYMCGRDCQIIGNSHFQLYKVMPSCFPKWLYQLYSYQQCRKVSLAPYTC